MSSSFVHQPKCLITGCALVVDHGSRWAWGDLHRIGNSYVFNAAEYDARETKWQYDMKNLRGPSVHILHADNIFDRRGVVVFSLSVAVLDALAEKRIRRDGS